MKDQAFGGLPSNQLLLGDVHVIAIRWGAVSPLSIEMRLIIVELLWLPSRCCEVLNGESN